VLQKEQLESQRGIAACPERHWAFKLRPLPTALLQRKAHTTQV